MSLGLFGYQRETDDMSSFYGVWPMFGLALYNEIIFFVEIKPQKSFSRSLIKDIDGCKQP